MLTGERALARTGIDAVALKPAECDVSRALDLPVDAVAIDYEGREHLPDAATLRSVAAEKDVWLTTPVRADGFDPLGDRRLLEELPDGVNRVLVAGHDAYLTPAERRRTIAPRLRAARESDPAAWIGTEGIERLALAVGGTQYELLSATALGDIRALRAAGFEDDIAVYAPTVLSTDEDEVLDAVGSYAARRRPVARALPEDAVADSRATGRARDVLLDAVSEYALVGTPDAIGERVERLREAGATAIVGYPARGVEEFVG